MQIDLCCPTAMLLPLTRELSSGKLLQRGVCRASACWDGRELSVPRGDGRLQEYTREQGCLQAQRNGEIMECKTQGHGVTCWKMFILSPG